LIDQDNVFGHPEGGDSEAFRISRKRSKQSAAGHAVGSHREYSNFHQESPTIV
jgi:hypothetical protein